MRLVGYHTYHLSVDGQKTLCGRRINSDWGTNQIISEDDVLSCLIDGADVDCNLCLVKLTEEE